MNYLSHQAVAEAVDPQASAWFYVGNLLPDLLSTAGRRLHEGELSRAVAIPPAEPETVALVRGIRLHFATDARFHSHPAFKEASALASELLRAAPFASPPHRVFFIAHVLVEIALDGRLVNERPDLPASLYASLEHLGGETIARRTASLLGLPDGLPDFALTITRFLAAHYLPSYRNFDGQAQALSRVCRRAGLPDLSEPGDRAALAGVCALFSPRLAQWEQELLAPPQTALPVESSVVVQ